MTISYKEGVTPINLREEIVNILPVIDKCFNSLGYNTVVVTCTTKDHSFGDPHTHGFAVDIRMHDYSVDLQDRLYNLVDRTLSGLYYTQLEFRGEQRAHLHIQVHKGIWQNILVYEKAKRL
jgi:hypothetical protein